MKLLIDNDFLLKMVAFGLLDCVLAYFKVSESDVRILPTARYKFFLKNPEKGRSKYGPVFDQLAATIERFAVPAQQRADEMIACRQISFTLVPSCRALMRAVFSRSSSTTMVRLAMALPAGGDTEPV